MRVLLLCSIFVPLCASGLELPLQAGEINGKMVVTDQTGARVKLACANWYGFHLEGMVINGLDKRPLADIVDTIAAMGFNCLRLPYALDNIYEDPVIPEQRLSANPGLVGKTSMEIMDAVVDELSRKGIMIILNNHISTAMWCCSTSDGEGFWYTDKYPEEQFFDHLSLLTTRYLSNPWVMGMDLRNELRRDGTLAPSWGDNNPETDWSTAAEEGARRVQQINPDMLIFVEGLNYALTLADAASDPIQLDIQNKLVYSGHMYTFSGPPSLPEDAFLEHMNNTQGFVTQPGQAYSAPYWMGETGTNVDSDEWQKILTFLRQNDFDWAYWSIDGYKYNDDGNQQDESYGLLLDDYETVRHPWKLQQLQELMPILS